MAQINQSKQEKASKQRKNKQVYGRKPERTVEMSFRTTNGGYVKHMVDVFTN